MKKKLPHFLVEDDLIAEDYLDKEFPKGKTKFRGQAMVLLALAEHNGIIKERKRIIKLFKFELDNRITSYNTLEKLDKIKKEIK